MSIDVWQFSVGAAGAFAGEILKLWEYHGKLSSEKYRNLAASPLFWGVFLGMIGASGFIAWAVNSGQEVTPIQLVMTGIGARGIVRGAAEAKVANSPTMLGDRTKDASRPSLADLFS